MAEEMFETDDVVAAEDALDSIFKEKDSVIGFIKDRYKRSEDSRYADEQRWLKAYRNYRGLYGSDVQFTDAEKSRIFVKVTKTKTLAAYGQIVDVLFLFLNQIFEPTKPKGNSYSVFFLKKKK